MGALNRAVSSADCKSVASAMAVRFLPPPPLYKYCINDMKCSICGQPFSLVSTKPLNRKKENNGRQTCSETCKNKWDNP